MFNKGCSLLFCFVLAILTSGYGLCADSNKISADRTQIKIDSKELSIECYEINDNNYVKLRDLAAVFNLTQKPFNIHWDADTERISVLSDKKYTHIGNELHALPDVYLSDIVSNPMTIELNGELKDINAYEINDNNYFVLHDFLKALNIYINYDDKNSTVMIDTQKAYDLHTKKLPVAVPILLYHHITDNPANPMSVSAQKFKNDMMQIKNGGYTTLLPQDLIDCVKNNTFPEKPIIISFDDGYESTYIHAYPILKELDMKAICSIVGISVDSPSENSLPHFSIEQAKEMLDSGLISIEMHSFNMHTETDVDLNIERGLIPLNPMSAKDYVKTFKDDFTAIYDMIYNNLGYAPLVYSYPYGLTNDLVDAYLKTNNIPITFSVNNSFSTIKHEADLYRLQRLIVTQGMSSSDLINTIEDLIVSAK